MNIENSNFETEKNNPKNKLSKIRPMLTGYVVITSIDTENNHKFISFQSIGLLVDSYALLIQKSELTPKIITNPLTQIKFFSSLTNEDNTECNSSLRENNILRLTNDTKLDDFNKTEWLLVCLSNPFGDYLFQFNQLDEKYFEIAPYTEGDKIFITYSQDQTSIEGTFDTEGIKPHNLRTISAVVYFVNEEQIFCLIENPKANLMHDFGFIITENLKVISTSTGKLIDYAECYKKYQKILQKNYFYSKFESIFSDKKSHNYKFLVGNLFTRKESEDFTSTLNFIKNTFYCDVGLLNFNSNVLHFFLEDSKNKTPMKLFITGENLTRKMSNMFKVKDLDTNLIIRKVMSRSLRNSNPVETLDLVKFNFGLTHFKAIFDSFAFYKQLLEVNLSSTPLDFKKCEVIAFFWYNNPQVIRMNLSNTNLPLKGVFVVTKAMLQHSSKMVDVFDISNNNINTSNFEVVEPGSKFEEEECNFTCPFNLNFIGEVIASGKVSRLKLQNLQNIKKTNFPTWDSDRIISSLFKTVKKFPIEDKLTYLNLSYWDLSHLEVITNMARCVSEMKNLQKFIIASCEINDRGFVVLSEMLTRRENVFEILDLSVNRITQNSANRTKLLFESYSDNKVDIKTFKTFTLNLSGNTSLSDQDALIYVGINFTLLPVYLYLSNTEINLDALSALANCLKRGMSIVFLDVSNNSITDDMLELSDIGSGLALNNSIKNIHLQKNLISYDGLFKLVRLLNGKIVKIMFNYFTTVHSHFEPEDYDDESSIAAHNNVLNCIQFYKK